MGAFIGRRKSNPGKATQPKNNDNKDMWFDAGVNLTNKRLLSDLEGVLARAHDAGVERMLVIATNEQESQQAINLCEQYPGRLVATVGVHPHDASEVSENYVDILEELARHPSVVAIGECGLDFNRNYSPAADQQQVFTQQVLLANRLGLPLYLHERDAQQQQLEILNQHCAEHTVCLSHCFTGGPEQAQAYIKRGHWFGLTGWLCDERRNKELLEALQLLPRDKVVIETDAPFLLPRNIKPRPKMNEPSLLPFVGEGLAEGWSTALEEVAQVTLDNSTRLFNLAELRG
ncbi:TatD family hydrolase [Idiomarina seosinensis]|nr:TatD family hydrolase [Idiomarina seosinensis]